jgi:hypothetical protein
MELRFYAPHPERPSGIAPVGWTAVPFSTVFRIRRFVSFCVSQRVSTVTFTALSVFLRGTHIQQDDFFIFHVDIYLPLSINLNHIKV